MSASRKFSCQQYQHFKVLQQMLKIKTTLNFIRLCKNGILINYFIWDTDKNIVKV